MPMLLYLAGTLEVTVRGFMLGFGAKMLQFMILDGQEDKLERLTARLRVAIVFGVATACVIVGSSMFLPANMRVHWIQYED